MRIRCISLMCISVALTIAVSTTPAYAAPKRFMVVLLDASGSMLEVTNGETRFQAAARVAVEEVNSLANLENELLVDVYTFQALGTGPNLIRHTNGFISTRAVGLGVVDIIECVGGVPVPVGEERDCNLIPTEMLAPTHQFPAPATGATPLADGMCNTLLTLLESGAATDLRLLHISSDGLENFSSGSCSGTFDGVFDPVARTWSVGSWQRKVVDAFFNRGVSTSVALFEFPGRPAIARFGLDREAPFLGGGASRFPVMSATAAISPLQQFFLSLVQSSGGKVRVFFDNEPPPILADVNGGQCVDITDALAVARAFGRPAFGSAFDLSSDGIIGFDDYQLVRLGMTPGCGAPDPFVRRDPIVCDSPRQIVIDGQAVESGAITVDVRSACQIVIRNSLLVSGQNAITINGSAVVRVDNSTIVGPNALLGTRGTVILSAANSVFHGSISTTGAFSFIDRGGNVFE